MIRPTGLVDPVLHVKPARGQVPDLVEEIKKRAERKERVLVTTLTKRLAEDLSELLPRGRACAANGCTRSSTPSSACRSCASCAKGAFDVLVGVNLLREGLDLPEVSLVAILDADKEGFLRSETSLIQTIGRAARNVNAEVILYADKVTDSMQRAIDETKRRRRVAAGVQRRARHHAGDGAVGDQHRASRRRSRRTNWQTRRPAARRRITSRRSTWRSCTREMLAGGGEPGVRAGGRVAR